MTHATPVRSPLLRAPWMHAMDAAAAGGRIALQRCEECHAVQYPPRPVCVVCLADAPGWTIEDFHDGVLLAETTLHHSLDPEAAPGLPCRLGLVRLAPGAVALCFLDGGSPGETLRVTARLDPAGRAVLHAAPQVTS